MLKWSPGVSKVCFSVNATPELVSCFWPAVCCLLLACDSWTAVSCCEANGGVIKLCGSLGVPRFTPPHWVKAHLGPKPPSLHSETSRGSHQCKRSQTLCLRTFPPHHVFFFVCLPFYRRSYVSFLKSGNQTSSSGSSLAHWSCCSVKNAVNSWILSAFSEKHSTVPDEAMTAWVEMLLERLRYVIIKCELLLLMEVWLLEASDVEWWQWVWDEKWSCY